MPEKPIDDTALLTVGLDHVTLHTDDLPGAVRRFADGYGFQVYATAGSNEAPTAVALGRDDIRLRLDCPDEDDTPARAFTLSHGEGVADIAFSTSDAKAAFTAAVSRGASVISPPQERDGLVLATVGGFADVTHTFVERPDGSTTLPGLAPCAAQAPGRASGLTGIDHFAVVLESGQLRPTVEFYVQVFGFEPIFAERITIGAQAMDSEVVQSRSGAITFTLLEPDAALEPGQLDEFLKNFGGGGVQHIAFCSTDIVASVRTMRASGVEFLSGPAAYYRLLAQRMAPNAHSIEDLQSTSVLADEDHDGQLFQIFARSVLPRNTLFYELIERVGARTFGTRNITSLYEAVELERLG